MKTAKNSKGFDASGSLILYFQTITAMNKQPHQQAPTEAQRPEAGSLKSVNPATGQTIATYDASTKEYIEAAMQAAQQAFQSWRRQSFEDRAVVLRRIAARLRQEQESMAVLAAREMGKPIQQGRDEVAKCDRTLDYYAQHGAAYLADERIATDARKSYIHYEPLGTVLAIMPWNFPYWQTFRCMAPILMGGNTMLLKHASNVSGCALAIERVVRESGAPEGLFAALLVPSAGVEALIEHPAVAAVTFTGSTGAGRAVAAVAGRCLKKQVLELGGSDAYIILEDADMDLAVETCVKGRLVNSGQSCVAAKRFIVHQKVRAAFERRMTERMQAASFGDPLHEDSRIGPMARADLRDQLHEQVQQSIAAGARLLCGGFIPGQNGAWYPPTVLTDVQPGMPAYDEELFGPVAAIMEARDEAHAIALANDSIFGLGAGIFSQNRERAEAIAARELEAGNCFVNAFVHSDPRLPFGGVKQSGYGRELGAWGIREFTNVKTVFIQ
jgi:succinate-semialdehyde dehydrogenase/glutarate-semialdehyde dehydrogenase